MGNDKNANQRGKNYWEANWNQAAYLDQMIANKQDPKMGVIATYAKIMDCQFENYGQAQSFIRRNLRPAKDLSLYSLDRISKTLDYILRVQTFINKPSLETILKYIDHNVEVFDDRTPIMVYQGKPIYDVSTIAELDKQKKIFYDKNQWRELPANG